MNTENNTGHYQSQNSIIEEWKVIEGFENYAVSTLGIVKNIKTGRTLKHGHTGEGYLKVSLCKNNKVVQFRIHKLVALTFIPNPENKPTIDHVNRDRRDNRVDNLRWATWFEQRDNVEGVSKKTPIVAFKDGVKYEFDSQHDCANYLSLDVPSVNKCLKGKRKTHKGYTFSYLIL